MDKFYPISFESLHRNKIPGRGPEISAKIQM